jgi:Tfp pilus assembly protein PilN
VKPVNLLPPQYRSAQASGARNGSAYVVVGVLALLLLLALPWTLTGNEINSSRSQLATVNAEVATLEQKIAGESAFASFRAVKETRLASVSALASGRFDWERVMRELALLMPRRSWLLNVTATTVDPNAATPAAGTGPPAAGSLNPQIKVVGCAVRQREVADLLVRLRKIHRASEVKLAESVEEVAVGGVSSDGAPSTDSCPPRRFQFDVTVTFDPVPPVDAAKHRVPASLGGGS